MKKRNSGIRDKIIKGLALSSKKLLKSKKDRNLDFVISHNGRVMKLHADKFHKLELQAR